MCGTNPALTAYHLMAEDFSERCEQALQRFMAEFGITERDKAMRHIVQDWLISQGYAETREGKAERTEGDSGRDPEFVQYPSYYKDGGTL